MASSRTRVIAHGYRPAKLATIDPGVGACRRDFDSGTRYPTSRYRTSTAEYVPPERETPVSSFRTSVRWLAFPISRLIAITGR